MKKKLMKTTENSPTPKLVSADAAEPMNVENTDASNIF